MSNFVQLPVDLAPLPVDFADYLVSWQNELWDAIHYFESDAAGTMPSPLPTTFAPAPLPAFRTTSSSLCDALGKDWITIPLQLPGPPASEYFPFLSFSPGNVNEGRANDEDPSPSLPQPTQALFSPKPEEKTYNTSTSHHVNGADNPSSGIKAVERGLSTPRRGPTRTRRKRHQEQASPYTLKTMQKTEERATTPLATAGPSQKKVRGKRRDLHGWKD